MERRLDEQAQSVPVASSVDHARAPRGKVSAASPETTERGTQMSNAAPDGTKTPVSLAYLCTNMHSERPVAGSPSAGRQGTEMESEYCGHATIKASRGAVCYVGQFNTGDLWRSIDRRPRSTHRELLATCSYRSRPFSHLAGSIPWPPILAHIGSRLCVTAVTALIISTNKAS